MTKPMASAEIRMRIGLSCTAVVVGGLLLGGCANGPIRSSLLSGAEPVERVVGPHDKVTPGGGRYQVGKPYTIGGRTYVPREDPSLDETGVASWYGGDYHHGTRTANGEVFDRSTISAAHRTMPLPSYARITNVRNGRSIVVRVNDRGPYIGNRIVDISERTAELLEMKRGGLGRVRVQYVGRAGVGGSDSRVLAATLRGPDLAPAPDERILLAQADLRTGPRQAPSFTAPSVTAPTLVASVASPPAPQGAAQASLFAAGARAGVPAPRPTTLALATDASSFELAGVDPRVLKAALQPLPKPAASSAEVIAAQMPGASGAPMSILPVFANGTVAATEPGDDEAPGLTSRTSSYVAGDRISAAHDIFAPMGSGARFATLAN